jgi:hypothetical protein
MKYRKIILCVIALFPVLALAQNNFWHPVPNVPEAQKLHGTTRILEYKTYELDLEGFKDHILSAPYRNQKALRPVTTDFPDSEGNLKSFELYKTHTMSPGLAAKFPSISSYAGTSEDGKYSLRLTITNQGIFGMISGTDGDVFINPLTASSRFYKVFNKKNAFRENPLKCLVKSSETIHPKKNSENTTMPDDGKLREYRLAVATTGEYSQYHINLAGVSGGTTTQKKTAVMNAIVVTMNRVNGIFERDLAISMVLVPNNEDLIFLNANTDPFSNFNTFQLIDESQIEIDNVIGPANYDIGHTFSTGGGGLASLASVCTLDKASGVTGGSDPIGDAFDVDFVAHEMGHQFGANHTFNDFCNGNINFPTAIEPGSGSTVMGYAGVCFPSVQPHSDAYFHTISIDEINAVITTATCGTATTIANTAPTIASLPTTYTIPYGTAFVLTASAFDAEGDTMTYCWEQVDNGNAPNPPSSTSTEGPLFRSFEPDLLPHRFFPNINAILAGNLAPMWEVVPDVARTMDFTLTVRDNNILGGQTATEDVTIIVANTGPFTVTSQNSDGIVYDTGQQFQVTWNVAGTNTGGVNATNVDIFLSVDGGYTYPVLLADNVGNDGAHTVSVPDGSGGGPDCRIMVKGFNNIFFDINNNYLTINDLSTDEFENQTFAIVPNPNNGEFTLRFFNPIERNITAKIFDLNGRIIGKHELNANGRTEKTIKLRGPQPGIYLLQISNGDTKTTKKLIVK